MSDEQLAAEAQRIEIVHKILHEFTGRPCRTDGGWCDARDHAEHILSALQQAQAPIVVSDSTPLMAAALLTKLKEECESQHARAEAAEAKLAVLEQAQARPEIEMLTAKWRDPNSQVGETVLTTYADRTIASMCADELEAVGAASPRERGEQPAATLRNQQLANVIREAISHLDLTPIQKALVVENVYSAVNPPPARAEQP